MNQPSAEYEHYKLAEAWLRDAKDDRADQPIETTIVDLLTALVHAVLAQGKPHD